MEFGIGRGSKVGSGCKLGKQDMWRIQSACPIVLRSSHGARLRYLLQSAPLVAVAPVRSGCAGQELVAPRAPSKSAYVIAVCVPSELGILVTLATHLSEHVARRDRKASEAC